MSDVKFCSIYRERRTTVFENEIISINTRTQAFEGLSVYKRI